MNTDQKIIEELKALADPVKRVVLPKFFKTGKGQYGEGDKFIGVTVPNIRSVAKAHVDADEDVVATLLASPWHEKRMCGLLIMVEQCKQTRKRMWLKAHSEEEGESVRRQWYEFYLAHTDKINNWDLVDLTAPTIVGGHLIGKSHDTLYRLAGSPLLWNQRIAVVSTFAFIRAYDFNDIYALATLLLHHPHDLMQKAIGWMLREAGKRDKECLVSFLDANYSDMPRTMLRYAIEKFTDEERAHYMRR